MIVSPSCWGFTLGLENLVRMDRGWVSTSCNLWSLRTDAAAPDFGLFHSSYGFVRIFYTEAGLSSCLLTHLSFCDCHARFQFTLLFKPAPSACAVYRSGLSQPGLLMIMYTLFAFTLPSDLPVVLWCVCTGCASERKLGFFLSFSLWFCRNSGSGIRRELCSVLIFTVTVCSKCWIEGTVLGW